MRIQQIVRAIITGATSVAALLTLQTAAAIGQGLPRDLSPQPLAQALEIFAVQTGLQLVYRAEIAAGLQSKGARAGLSAEETLRELLRDTGLTFVFVNDRTIALKRPDKPEVISGPRPKPTTTRTTKANEHANERTHFAQVESSTQSSSSRPEEDKNSGSRVIEEIVVTGSHIRGVGPVGSPLITIDRSEIERTGYATVQDVIRTVPQNFSGSESDLTLAVGGFDQNSFTFGAGIDLRGLGADATLTLLNGRRLAAAGIGSFVDISAIPLTMVDRIEIIPDGASAIYGSDAIGGVVNVRLRDSFEGAETRLRYGQITRGNVSETELGQVFGSTWNGGRILFGYEYYERESLDSSARIFTADSDLSRFGGDNFSALESNPGNILQIGDTPVSLAVPRGQDGTALSEADLLGDQVNFQNLRESDELLPDHKRHGAALSISQELGNKARSYFDVLYSERDYRHRAARQGAIITIPESNAYRQLNNLFPGAGDITMAHDLTDDFGSTMRFGTSKTVNGIAGTSLQVGDSWTTDFALTYGSVDETLVQPRRVDLIALSDALASGTVDSAFNPFADGSNTNAIVLESLLGRENALSETRIRSINFQAEGDIFRLSGGNAKVAIGGELRDERYSFSDVEFSAAGVPQVCRRCSHP